MRRRSRRWSSPRLCLQSLEQRLAPATFTVSNIANTGTGSLRQAILDSNATPSVTDTIVFQPGLTGTILLASTLAITDDVTITGPGAAAIAVSGQNTVRVFNIDDGNTVITVTISGLTVTGGRTTSLDGGGLATANEAVTLDGVVVSNNVADGAGCDGGGIGVGSGGSLTVRNSTISGNSSSGAGGGLYFINGGSLLLENSTVSGNTAADANGGGGVYFFGAVASVFTIQNSTIANNTAPSGGGVARNTLSTAVAPVLIRNSTITGNASTTTATTAGLGGGGLAVESINGSASVTIVSTIVSGNSATAANGQGDIVAAAAPGFTLSVANSAVGDPDGFTINGANVGNLAPGATLGLGTLANNGGPTQTIAFFANSPLRDAGSNPGGLPTDQRGPGFTRVRDSAPDIGALEVFFPVVTTLNNSGPGSLRQVIEDANATIGVAETITFQAGLTGTLTLLSQLLITDGVTIAGPGAAALTVSGNNAVRPFVINDANINTAAAVTLSGLTVTAGQAGASGGGGIFVTDEAVTLDRIVVSNSTTPGKGGGVSVQGAGRLTIRNSTISGNSATVSGGGIYLYSGASLLLENSTVSGNTAASGFGGGVVLVGAVGAGGLTLRNSTVANNTALVGGGLGFTAVSTSAAPVLIQNSTITGNTATTTSTQAGYGGGGLAAANNVGATVTVVSSIVSGNAAANGRSDIASDGGTTLNVSNSAIGDPDGFTINGTNTNNLAFNTPLGLLPLANNGGPTQTIAFASTSPLINAGATPPGLTTDQRGAGFPRVVGGTADIGAFEGHFPVVTNLTNAGPGSLRQAILDSNASVGFAETITFQPGLTGAMNLTSSLLISESVSISGPGATALTVSGQGNSTPFAIFNGNSILSVTISGLTVTNGRPGIDISNEAVTLDGVVVTNCTSFSSGAGIRSNSGGRLTVRNSTISGNSAPSDGGGIYLFSGSLLLENSTVSGNTAAGSDGGGGIYFGGTVATGGVTIRNSTIANNTAPSGGGVTLRGLNTAAAPVLIQNSTITGNASTTTATSAGYGGGGLAAPGFGATPTISVVSTIISGNSATAANGRSDVALAAGTVVNLNFSAVGDPDGVALSGTSDDNLPVGTALGLLPLANNGGPTQTVAFASNSPLINAGANPANLNTDQRGFARVIGTAIDIGAFEGNFPVVTNLNNFGAGSLRQAILDANATPGFAETISFQAGLTGAINLNETLPITDGVTITGPGAAVVTVSGQHAVRVFTIDNAASSVIAVAISGLTVTGGRVTGGDGGGLFTANEAVTLDGVVVTNNAAAGIVADGGGIGVGPGGRLTVRNSTISGNSAGSAGGGIYLSSGSLFMEDSTLSGNSAAAERGGGGIFFTGPVPAGGFTIRNSTIANNTGANGGGLALLQLNTAAAPVLIQNSTITGNVSTTTSTTPGYGGGGIALLTGDAATITVVSTIVSGNTAATANGRSDLAIPTTATVNVTFSAIGDADGFTLSGIFNNNLAIGVALGLGALTNGGPTQTIAFGVNSPLRNAGANPANLTTDQRGAGFPRIFGAAPDIGAYELQSASAAARVGSVVLNSGQANTVQRSRVTSVTVTFDTAVTFSGTAAGAFQLARIGGGAVGGFTATANVVNGVTVVTLTGFTGAETQFGSLADGRYTLTVLATQVAANSQQLDGNGDGTGGDNFLFADAGPGTTGNQFFRLFGDANGDRIVNAADTNLFRLVLGASTTDPTFDVNGDGVINSADLNFYRVNLGGGI